MRVAVSSPSFCHEPFEAMLPKVASQFGVWEIVAEGNHVLWDIAKSFRDLTPSYDLGFQCHAPISDVNVGAANPRAHAFAVAEFRKTVEWAGQLGIPKVTVHPGWFSTLTKGRPELVRKNTTEALKVVMRQARDSGVTVCLENMPAVPFAAYTTPQDMLLALERLGDGALKLTFDAAHAHVAKSVSEFMPLRSLFGNVHLSDNLGDRDAHLPLGQGTVPLPEVVRSLGGYEGTLVIEAPDWEGALAGKRVLAGLLANA